MEFNARVMEDAVKSTVLVAAAALAAAFSVPCARAADAVSVDVPVQGRENVSYAYADVLRADPIYENVPQAATCSIPESGNVTVRGDGNSQQDDILPSDDIDDNETAEAINEAIDHPGSEALPASSLAVQTAATGLPGDPATPPPAICAAAQRRIAAYDVEYRYKGVLFMSRMDYDPGNKLRIRITVAPAD